MAERPPAMPERLGRYEIVERLSAGGMGEVFIARYVGPGGFVKPVALKRIHPHLAEDEQFINMLHDEANVAAAVKHPNIVVTIDVGFDRGNHFVVMDFVSGDTLSRLVRELRRRDVVMPPWAVAWIGAQTAAALHSAHEAKNLLGEPLDIVHRDVSLQNIMLSDAGHPMLFDFGVAKARQRIVQTTHGELKGKLAYMAPETFRGQQVDRTVDVFSLGVVLYELLTNVSPFQRESDIDTITALQTAPIALPSQMRPVDPRLDSIVLAAMARDRSRRYPTAAHVEYALREWARSSNVPHEAGVVARWLEATFPERLAARRALLQRVADPARRIPEARPSQPQQGSSPGAQGGWGITPGSGTTPEIQVSLATDPGTISSSPTVLRGDTPATGSQVTVAGVSRHATFGNTRSTRLVALAIGGAGVIAGSLAAALILVHGSATPSVAPATAATTAASAAPPPTTSAAPEPTATASAEPAASAVAAPTATATATAKSAAPAPRPPVQPARPAEPPRSRGRGPIVREY